MWPKPRTLKLSDNVTFISVERPNTVVAQEIVIGDQNHISKGQISKELPPRSSTTSTNGKSFSIMRRKQDFTIDI
jgi:hypothetical protein